MGEPDTDTEDEDWQDAGEGGEAQGEEEEEEEGEVTLREDLPPGDHQPAPLPPVAAPGQLEEPPQGEGGRVVEEEEEWEEPPGLVQGGRGEEEDSGDEEEEDSGDEESEGSGEEEDEDSGEEEEEEEEGGEVVVEGQGEEEVNGEEGEEYGELADRVSPELPGPRVTQPGEETADGWHRIDQLGALECFLSRFTTVKEVPGPYEAAWTQAWVTVLQREAAAESPLAKERALKWFCFLSQGLLRTPRRGSRAGRGAVAKRFRAVTLGDWGSLVTMWQEDVARTEERDRRREGRVRTRLQDRVEEEEKIKREVLRLIGTCEVGKAVSRLNSNGVASMEDPVVRQQMAAKYPAREQELPARVIKAEAVSNLRGLREALKALKRRKSPGAGGLRPEFLQVVGERMEGEDMRLLEDWGRRFLHGELPSWFYVVWLSIQTVPLYKTTTRDTVRPIGMRNPLSKLLNSLMIRENKGELVDFLEPQQLAMSQAGSAKLVHCVRMMAEKELLVRDTREEGEEEMVGVKIDVKNAFNNCSASSIITTMEEEESLKHMAWATACQLAPEQPLEAGGRRWGTRRTGSTQGDSAGPPQFCVSWHPQVRVLDATLRAVGGLARFGMDDGYCWGPPSVLFPALARFKEDIKEHCSLELEVSKSECFTWSGQLPAEAPSDLTLAGAMVEGRWETGWVVYGCPVGTDAYVGHMLDHKVSELSRGASRAKEVLGEEAQSLWAVLRLSLQQQFGYWLSLVHPTQVAAAADRVDTILLGVLEEVAGFDIPQGGGHSFTCAMGPEVGWLEGRSFQQITSSLPIKSGGLGLRSQLDLSPAAWVGALEQALPFFSGEKGVCPPLAELAGEEEDDLHRWRPLLESGLRTGEELRQAWATLQQRAQQMSDYLGEESLTGPLEVDVEGAGVGSTTGATRMAITTQLEGLTLSTLTKHLGEYRHRKARPVCLNQQKDKMTTAWLLALPTPQGSISSPIFREGLAMVLALPSPACRDRVGQRIGGGRVDVWGDVVKCDNSLIGGGWTIRHDRTKGEIMRMLSWSGIVATCEVSGLFQHLVPPAAQDRPEVKRQSHVMIPDFRLQLPHTTPGLDLAPGETATRLAELKFTCSEQHYRTGVRQREFQRAVERRAGLLMGEYQAKADRMDTLLGEEGRGRVRRQLDQYGKLVGVVVGKYLELSEGGHLLLDAMASSRVASQERTSGLASANAAMEVGVVRGELRRQLSVVNLRASMACLLDRLHQAGEGGRMRGKRQEWMVREEERMRDEREMIWAARVRGRSLLQPGRIIQH